MKVSVIVVNWKVRDLLRECLLTLKTDTTLAIEEWELFVVDNDSADGSVEMLRDEFPQARLIANEKNLGFGAANNQAAALARGEYLLLLNPDTKVQGDAVRKLTQLLDTQRDIGIAGPRLLNGDLTLQRWTAGAFLTLSNAASHYLFWDRLLPRPIRPPPLYLDRDVPHDIDVDWISGACMVIRRAALRDQLFDLRFFMYSEDMELCHRLKRCGWRIVYTPSVSIVHYHGASLKQQEGEHLLSALKGPRKFFKITHGRVALHVLDTLVLAGFLLRASGFGIAALLHPKRFSGKARLSKRYVAMAKAVWGSH